MNRKEASDGERAVQGAYRLSDAVRYERRRAVVSLLTGLVYKVSTVVPPPIPFSVMACVSLGCVVLIPAYHGLLRLLSN